MPKTTPRRIKVRLYTRYGNRKVHVRARIVGERHIGIGSKIELTLYHQQSGKVHGVKTVPALVGKEVTFDTRTAPDSCHDFRAAFIDRDGQRLQTTTLLDSLPGLYPWFESKEGISRTVRAPWTPLHLRRTRGEVEISCWGRVYTISRNGFIAQIDSVGRKLLKRPVRPVAQVDGKEIRWQGKALRVVSQARDLIVLEQEFRSGCLTVASRIELEFDGMVRVDWKLSTDAVTRLDALSIDVPVADAVAKYLYHFPGQWGGVRNVGALPPRGAKMAFRPFVWLGDEEVGLSWFAESDDGFVVGDPRAVTEVIRSGDTAKLRVNLVSKAVKLIPGKVRGKGFTGWGEDLTPFAPGGVVTQELRYTFGMQATPVKPIVEDAWDQRIFCITPGTPGFRPRMNVSNALLDQIVEAGVRHVVLFEAWADAEGYTKTPHGKALQKIVKACHERGLKVLFYFSFLVSDLTDEWQDFGKDSLILPKGGYPVFHYFPQPEQSAWRVCLNSAWQDALVHGIADVMDRFDIDGVYLDGTEYPFPCCNTEHGCGAIRDDGSIAQTVPIFGVRSAMRRIHEVVKSRKRDGLLNVHNSTCMTMPTLGWASSYWDGEQFQGVTKGADVGQLLPLDAFRAEFMGRQWGVPAEFLHAGSAYTYREAWSFSLLHDIPVRPHGTGEDISAGDLGLASSVWKAMDAFGRKKAEWLPYWRNAGLVSVSLKNAYVSLYRHPRNGILAVVSNQHGEQQDVTVRLNLRKLGLKSESPQISDALTGKSVQSSNGVLKLSLPSLGWRLLRIK